MTLGGLALAVGILVDDATVTIENIERFLEQGYALREAILEGASQIAVPALVSTLCICIVFLPMFFLGGVAKFLFIPLAEAVVFAMLASYLLSRTLVPTLAVYLLRAKEHGATAAKGSFARFQRGFERVFERVRERYHALLQGLVLRRYIFIPSFLGLCLAAFVLAPFLAKIFSLRPTAANSFFMSGALRECALKRLHACSIWWRARSAGKYQLRRSATFSTTSACLTAP
jgi:multidrug efflux pump subunit AcrB